MRRRLMVGHSATRLAERSLGFILSLVFCSTAWAHKPTFSDGSAKDVNQAYRIKDADVSVVFYHEATPQAGQLWLTFDGKKDQTLYVQIGVPELDRLKNYRPAVAVLGQGLPGVPSPFPGPAGLGGKIITTNDVTAPISFHEEFTDTRSWILKEDRVRLPADGRYYIVGYVPSGEPGKFWVAVGEREAFGRADWARMGEWTIAARRFHEVTGPPEYLKIPCPVNILLLLVSLALIL
jgi:hypothetical protein